jgi:Ca-activated chloride channel homolog
MMQWRDSMSLAALVLAPALALFLVWSLRRRHHALALFVASGLLPAVTPDLDPRRRTLRAVLLCLAVLALGLALGGPMWGFRWQQVQREGIDLIVAIDTSRSMLATDVKPNRLARAKLAVQDLLSQLAGDRIGLVAFAGTAFLQCPLTLDFGAFSQSLEAVEAGIIPRGGTSLSAAIETSLDAFEGRQAEHQALVIITDGEDLSGDLDAAIKQATDRGVKIYTVGIGTSEGELIPLQQGGFVKDRKGQVVKSRLDETTLQKIATDTGGAYLHATDTAFGLTELYRDYIATMEKRELASTLERRFEHRFQWPLFLAFLLLLIEPLIGERRQDPRPRSPRRRWPWRRRTPEPQMARSAPASPASRGAEAA